MRERQPTANQLKLFVKVIKHLQKHPTGQSLRLIANALFPNKKNQHQYIKTVIDRVTEYLKIELIDTGTCELTPAGKQYATALISKVELLEDAYARLDNLTTTANQVQQIRIATYPSIVPYMLREATRLFVEKYREDFDTSGISVHIKFSIDCNHSTAIQALAHSEFDIVVMTQTRSMFGKSIAFNGIDEEPLPYRWNEYGLIFPIDDSSARINGVHARLRECLTQSIEPLFDILTGSAGPVTLIHCLASGVANEDVLIELVDLACRRPGSVFMHAEGKTRVDAAGRSFKIATATNRLSRLYCQSGIPGCVAVGTRPDRPDHLEQFKFGMIGYDLPGPNQRLGFIPIKYFVASLQQAMKSERIVIENERLLELLSPPVGQGVGRKEKPEALVLRLLQDNQVALFTRTTSTGSGLQSLAVTRFIACIKDVCAGKLNSEPSESDPYQKLEYEKDSEGRKFLIHRLNV